MKRISIMQISLFLQSRQIAGLKNNTLVTNKCHSFKKMAQFLPSNVILLHSTSKMGISESEFSSIADPFLDSIIEKLEPLDDIVEDIDVTCAQGVLTLKLGKYGTYVINKQTPNRQIWWSSPISGPKRFEYDDSSQQWLNNRDKTPLLDLLRKEIHTTIGIDIDFDKT